MRCSDLLVFRRLSLQLGTVFACLFLWRQPGVTSGPSTSLTPPYLREFWLGRKVVLKGVIWKMQGSRVAYMSQHAFHHIEAHLDKSATQYIMQRFAGGEESPPLIMYLIGGYLMYQTWFGT